MNTLRELIDHSRIEKIDTRVLLTHLCQEILNWPKSSLITRDTEVLPYEFLKSWHELEDRRLLGEPVAYLVGHRGFYDIDLKVAPGVLIPRPETELLVDLALQEIKRIIEQTQTTEQSSLKHKIRVLDLGTGSGAIALAIADAFRTTWGSHSDLEVTAVDQSDQALNIAKENCQRLGLDKLVHFFKSDWFCELEPSSQSFDMIVGNPPYIANNDPHLLEGDLRFEPRSALTDGADGLEAYRAILKSARKFMRSNALIALEHGYDQGIMIKNLFSDHGLVELSMIKDIAGQDRVMMGRAP